MPKWLREFPIILSAIAAYSFCVSVLLQIVVLMMHDEVSALDYLSVSDFLNGSIFPSVLVIALAIALLLSVIFAPGRDWASERSIDSFLEPTSKRIRPLGASIIACALSVLYDRWNTGALHFGVGTPFFLLAILFAIRATHLRLPFKKILAALWILLAPTGLVLALIISAAQKPCSDDITAKLSDGFVSGHNVDASNMGQIIKTKQGHTVFIPWGSVIYLDRYKCRDK